MAGESVSVLARAPIDDWLFIRTSGGLEGFVQQTYLHWSGDFQSLSIRQPPPGWAISTGENEFVLEYPGCIPHASDWGVVKGQVLNQDGSPIVGARVEMWLNGARWDDKANPATTNEDGWYEWIIAEGQAVRLSALYIDGRRVGFAPTDLIVITKGGCFHNLNFVKQ